MIRGTVNLRTEAVVYLRVQGPTGIVIDVEAVIDTGFSASLTLPAATIAALGLVHSSRSKAVLADGTVRRYDMYHAELEWVAGWRPVVVSGIGDSVLIGMKLLAGHEIRIAVEPSGVVEISALP